jgi:hypothetical protein
MGGTSLAHGVRFISAAERPAAREDEAGSAMNVRCVGCIAFMRVRRAHLFVGELRQYLQDT